ncbi:4556_t:CDS:2 [Cetraspora pellucida]|uniref:4556_t:CDS:1 n=1 Tax=Cetraspora pellucida TaxID=1433469 RepID=A0A9N8Z425_9GLOM|nr:4556_t:CDS:2 [Cetraspora pellucida]
MNTVDDKLFLPEYMKVLDQDLKSFINVIYPNIHVIETSMNTDNTLIEKGVDNNNIYPVEFLNILNPNGMPPVKLNLKIVSYYIAFVMTINKSQGQSIKHVGLDLHIPVFSYKQLYVALSCSTAPYSIKVLFPKDNTNNM